MDNVAALRDSYGADLVSLFVESGQYCGLGVDRPQRELCIQRHQSRLRVGQPELPARTRTQFRCTARHLCRRDQTPYAYGHGWVDVGQRWRDVMAYNNACAAAGVSCTRIPYLSNPHVTYGSPPNPLGSTSTADTTRVHNQNALTMANFRPAAGAARRTARGRCPRPARMFRLRPAPGRWAFPPRPVARGTRRAMRRGSPLPPVLRAPARWRIRTGRTAARRGTRR